MTEAQIRAAIAELYAEHPALKGVDPSDSCCAACFRHDLSGAFGWDAVDAWDAIQTYELRLTLGAHK